MSSGLEARFERYSDVMVETLGHADRATPARWYLRGLMLPGQRKSVEPMAARVHPQDVRSAPRGAQCGSSRCDDRGLIL